MGEVFLAEDTRLGRRVALKTLRRASADRPEARERLRREARATAALNHPNIAAIYDVFESEAGTHIVMEYVEGTSLDSVIRQGPLPVGRALDIALELASALDAAHARGIVHRDLKPSNVCLTTTGHAKVLDFGLARTLAPTGIDANQATHTLTGAHELVGTPAYMSPEQLRGARGDQRSDVYGLGVVLFEMLTGHRPYEAPTTIELAAAILTGPPPGVHQFRPDVPGEIAELVADAMARAPEARVQSAADFRARLEAYRLSHATPTPSRLPLPTPLRPPRPPSTSVWQRVGETFGSRRYLPVLVLLILLAGAAALWRVWGTGTSGGPAASGAPTPVVAVLPVVAEGGAERRDASASALGAVLVSQLGAIPGLQMVAYDAVRTYRGEHRDVRRAATDLAATYIVDATLQRAGSQLRLAAQLVDRRGLVAWSGTFDGTVNDPFELQRQFADAVGGALVDVRAIERGAFVQASQRLQRAPTTNVDAFRLYSEALALLERPDVAGHLDRAVALLEEATRRDPDFALAYASLGDACWAQYSETGETGWPDRASRAVLDALRLDPDEPHTRLALARILLGTGRADEARAELDQLVARHVDTDETHRELSEAYRALGLPDQAVAELHRAIELRPGYWRNHSYLGSLLYRLGRYEAALAPYRKVIELQPDSARGHQGLGTVLQAMGRTSEALAEYRLALKLSPSAGAWSNVGTAAYYAGQFTEAAEAYREAIKLKPDDPLLRRNLGDALEQLPDGRADADAVFRECTRIGRQQLGVNAKSGPMLGVLAVCEAKVGRHGDAARLAADAVDVAPDDLDVLFDSAVVAVRGRRLDAGATLLARALDKGYPHYMVKGNPDVKELASRDEIRSRLE